MRRAVLAVALLAACGEPPADAPADADATPDAPPPDGPCADLDEDGHLDAACGGDDCDDADPAVHPGAPDARWGYEAIAPSNGLGAAVRADATGWHVAWSGGGAWYARDGGDGWTIERVDDAPASGIHVSLAIAPDGTPHLAYADLERRALRYATRGPAGWTVETVDATEHAGFDSDLELVAGAPVILHTRHVDVRAGDELRWSWRDDGAWRTEVVATDVRRHHGGAAAVEGDAVALTWITHGGGGVAVATGGPGAWTRAALPDHPWAEWGADVARAGGAIHVVAGTETTLFVRSPDGAWTARALATTGYHPRLALAGDDVHVAVRGRDDTGDREALRLVDLGGGSEVVSTGGGFRPRIAVAPDGAVGVLAAHPATGELRLYRDRPDAADEDCDGAP